MRDTAILSAVEQQFGETDQAQVNVILVGTAEISALNRQFLGRSEATDVIAFDLSRQTTVPDMAEKKTAGEVYICLDVAVQAASAYSTSISHEVVLYIVHGFLHLAGYEDSTEAQSCRMRAAETEIMERLYQTYALNTIF